MRISDWSSDVCSSDLLKEARTVTAQMMRCTRMKHYCRSQLHSLIPAPELWRRVVRSEWCTVHTHCRDHLVPHYLPPPPTRTSHTPSIAMTDLTCCHPRFPGPAFPTPTHGHSHVIDPVRNLPRPPLHTHDRRCLSLQ